MQRNTINIHNLLDPRVCPRIDVSAIGLCFTCKDRIGGWISMAATMHVSLFEPKWCLKDLLLLEIYCTTTAITVAITTALTMTTIIVLVASTISSNMYIE